MSGTRILVIGRSVIQMRLDQLEHLEQLEQFQLMCGKATPEREARSIPQRAVREAHCELCVTQKVIDALLKALSTPWWTESSTDLNPENVENRGVTLHFLAPLSELYHAK